MKWPWISRKYADLLTHELAYYRLKCEAEKERADKAVDALVVMCGREPISEVSNKTHERVTVAAKEMQEQMGEIYGDVAKSILSESDQSGTDEESPEESPVAAIEQRLEKLKLIPFYNKPKSAEKSGSPAVPNSDTMVQ